MLKGFKADPTNLLPWTILTSMEFRDDAICKQIMGVMRNCIQRGHDEDGNETVLGPDNDSVVSAATVMWTDTKR
jgi:hypothetical protein